MPKRCKPCGAPCSSRNRAFPKALEWDGRDPRCVHVIAWNGDHAPIGAARMQADGHIGRMAVLADWRGRGVGSALLTRLIAAAQGRGLAEVWLSAQTSAAAFYERHGFIPEGPVYLEAEIPHVRMRRAVQPSPAARR